VVTTACTNILQKKLSSGKWGKSSGQCIGKVVEDKGFIPNKSYKADELFASVDEITVLEYGQYGLIYTVASPVLKNLNRILRRMSHLKSSAMPHLYMPMDLSMLIR